MLQLLFLDFKLYYAILICIHNIEHFFKNSCFSFRMSYRSHLISVLSANIFPTESEPSETWHICLIFIFTMFSETSTEPQTTGSTGGKTRTVAEVSRRSYSVSKQGLFLGGDGRRHFSTIVVHLRLFEAVRDKNDDHHAFTTERNICSTRLA